MTLYELGFHKVAVDFEHLLALPAERLKSLKRSYQKGLDTTNYAAEQIRLNRTVLDPITYGDPHVGTTKRLMRDNEFWGTLSLRDKTNRSLQDVDRAIRAKHTAALDEISQRHSVPVKDPRGGYGGQYSLADLKAMLAATQSNKNIIKYRQG